mgnify:CR=1 FL=1|jgi:hypothetical protein
MQALVFSLAIFRFFLLGSLELNNQINRITGEFSNITVLMSAFSYMIFGQLIDNQQISKQRYIFCALELSMGVWFILMAIFSFWDASHGRKTPETSINVKMEPLSFFLTSAF